MSNQQDFNDPFDQFDNLDGLDESFPELEDGLSDELPETHPEEDEFESNPAQGVPNNPAPAPSAAPSSQQPQQGPKPFLKTPIGMVSAGLAVVAVGVVGTVGYTSIVGGDDPVMNQPLAQEIIAPASEPDFSQTPVAGSFNEQAPQSPLQMQMQGMESAAVQAPAAQNQVLQTSLTPEVATQTATIPGASSPIALPQVNAGETDVLTQVLDEIKGQREDLKEVKEVVKVIASELEELKENAEKVTLEQIEIRKDLDKIRKAIKSGIKTTEVKATPAIETASMGDKNSTQTVSVANVENALASGRTRIGDFRVIDSSASGEMAIIKKESSGRVFTVFKGEVLIIGGKRLTVSSVEDKGTLVLVGDKLYIDKTLADKPVAAKPVKRSNPSANTQKAAKKSVVKNADNFTLNAVYDSDSSFGVVDSSGNFKSYKVGQSVPELGGARVKGLDKDGNLRVGDYVIKSIY